MPDGGTGGLVSVAGASAPTVIAVDPGRQRVCCASPGTGSVEVFAAGAGVPRLSIVDPVTHAERRASPLPGESSPGDVARARCT